MLQARKVSFQQYHQHQYKKRYTAVPQTRTRYRAQEKSRAKARLPIYIFLLICFILSVASVAQYCKIVTTNFEIGKAQKEIERLTEERKELELEIAGLNSLERIEGIARAGLELEEAQKIKIHTVAQNR